MVLFVMKAFPGVQISPDGIWKSLSGKNLEDYHNITPPEISLNRSQVYFGASTSGSATNSQTFLVNNSGGGILNWTVTDDASWISCTPSSGTNVGEVSVSVIPTGLSASTYTGTLTVSDSNDSSSPQTISVKLTVYAYGNTSLPFGNFATTIAGSTVASSIPVTGWVLDDVEVAGVEIYNGTAKVGDAIFVEGARPDVEQAYPGYPKNYQAGWGYMMLTNFLPNGGNGTYTIYAKAIDAEDHQVTLGAKTIFCDNADKNPINRLRQVSKPLSRRPASKRVNV